MKLKMVVEFEIDTSEYECDDDGGDKETLKEAMDIAVGIIRGHVDPPEGEKFTVSCMGRNKEEVW